jgi:hypothetical protein
LGRARDGLSTAKQNQIATQLAHRITDFRSTHGWLDIGHRNRRASTKLAKERPGADQAKKKQRRDFGIPSLAMQNVLRSEDARIDRSLRNLHSAMHAMKERMEGETMKLRRVVLGGCCCFRFLQRSARVPELLSLGTGSIWDFSLGGAWGE